MEKGECIRMNAAARREIRNIMHKMGFYEIQSPALEKGLTNPFSKQFKVQGASYEGYLTQRSNLSLVQAAAELSKVYSFDAVFRDDAPDLRNHLLEYHYLQAICPGKIEDAESVVRDIFCAVAAAVGSDTSQWQNVDHVTHQDAHAIVNIGPSDDMNLDQQLELAARFGGFVYLWDKPASLEPLQFNVRRDNPRHNFEVIANYAGEVGSGSELETNPDKAREAFKASHYRNAMIETACFNIDEIARPYFKSLGELRGDFISFGLSFERLLQAISGTQNINNVVDFPVLEVARVGAMP